MHLYIHIPYCISKCDYCDFFSIPLLNYNTDIPPEKIYVPEEYIDSLINEITYRLNTAKTDSLSTVYIGGGTPSLLLPEQIERIMNAIKKQCNLESGAEVTIEMNPETVTKEKLEACKKNGINRISLGIQSLCSGSLECVHRHCNPQNALNALEMIAKNWDGRFSVDVIAGLPNADDEQFISTIKKLIEYEPDHFSLYSLCIEEDTPLGKKIISGSEKSLEKIEDCADRQWLKGRELLKQNGYCQYEISNFAKKGFEAVHNSAYWNQEDYIGCGAGACGTLYSFGNTLKKINKIESYQNEINYSDLQGIRSTNTTDIGEYISFWKKNAEHSNLSFLEKDIPQEKELLDCETEEYEFLMMGLRMLKGIDEELFAERFCKNKCTGKSLLQRLNVNGSKWEEFKEKDYIKVYKNIHGKNVYALNEEGILFLNQLLESLL